MREFYVNVVFYTSFCSTLSCSAGSSAKDRIGRKSRVCVLMQLTAPVTPHSRAGGSSSRQHVVNCGSAAQTKSDPVASH